MNLNEAMKKWSVFQCLNLAFTLVLSSIAVALAGMFVSEYAWDIGLRLAVLVAGYTLFRKGQLDREEGEDRETL